MSARTVLLFYSLAIKFNYSVVQQLKSLLWVAVRPPVGYTSNVRPRLQFFLFTASHPSIRAAVSR